MPGVPVARFLADQRILVHPRNPGRPLVSVVMPTYKLRADGSNQRAVESVLAQSVGDFELIVVDDGSIDGLHDVLVDYQRADARIVLVRHETNSGLPALRVNEGLLLAKGRYVAYQFEDDEWTPDCLERLLATMGAGPGDALVYGIVEWLIQRSTGSVEAQRLGEGAFNYSLLKNRNLLANCAVLHPRAVLEACGLYDPHLLLRRSCDHDLWLRMTRVLPGRACSHVVARARSGGPDSLGALVDHDLVVTYRHMATERTEALRPDRIAAYEVDALPGTLGLEETYRLREHYIIPFWVQHPGVLTPAERRRLPVGRAHPNRLLVTKSDYSTSVDVTLGNFNRALDGEAQSWAFVQEAALPAVGTDSYDTLVLHRTIGEPSLAELARAQEAGKTVIYLIDDNMFKFGTSYLSEEFAYLKPGRRGYQVLEQEVAAADLVVTYSPALTAECRDRNPRVVELRTNILERHLDRARPPGRASGDPVRYAVLTGPARRKEISTLWPAFREFAERHRREVEFHFWGMDPAEFPPPLACPTFHRPFDHCYDSYLTAAAAAGFDFVLNPLFDDHDTKIAKSPVKYLEATAVGAVGLYSDAAAYRAVVHGRTGLKVADNIPAWLTAVEQSLTLSEAERRTLHEGARQHILDEFTTEAQVLPYLTAFEAADLHAILGSRRAPGGRAPIALFGHESLLGGATLHLLHHARILVSYGFRPILCFPGSAPLDPMAASLARDAGVELQQLDFVATVWRRGATAGDRQRAVALAHWMRASGVRLVHTVTYLADVLLAAREVGVPVVATLHQHHPDPGGGRRPGSPEGLVAAVHSSSLRYARRWQQELGAAAFCLRAPVGEAYFEAFSRRRPRPRRARPVVLVAGTLQERKGQLTAIHAVQALNRRGIELTLVLIGYDRLAPAYVAECRRAIQAGPWPERVEIVGFVPEPVAFYENADYVLCASADESMPQSILHGMACGARIVTTPVGGVRELILDGFSGVVTTGTGAEDIAQALERAIRLPEDQWRRMTHAAHETARMTCRREVVAYQLLRLYNLAGRTGRGREGQRREAGERRPRSRLLPLSGARGVLAARARGAARRLARWRDRVGWEGDHARALPAAFIRLREESLPAAARPRYRLVPSPDLDPVPFIGYRLDVRRPNLCGLTLAPLVGEQRPRGLLGIEIVSPERRIVTQATVRLDETVPGAPVRFEFQPIPDSARGGFWLHVFARDTDGPLRVLEWRPRLLSALAFTGTRPFCGFLFLDESPAVAPAQTRSGRP